MYEELIKRLREKAGAFDYDGRPDIACDYEQAADAIEKLQGKVKELYYLTCDVNKSEIMAQLEIGNLENFLHTFREYANKIADIQLPEPPKEET